MRCNYYVSIASLRQPFYLQARQRMSKLDTVLDIPLSGILGHKIATGQNCFDAAEPTIDKSVCITVGSVFVDFYPVGVGGIVQSFKIDSMNNIHCAAEDSYREVFDKAKQAARVHPFVLRMFCMCTVCIQ
ncbi:hypothetical protein Deiofobo_0400 [Pseudomonas phage Deifobo]|nr:hypothetical protein Deiofobo_0400 [Pseudomonas phage Deifobo]